MSEPKFCVDCKSHSRSIIGFSLCAESIEHDSVTGRAMAMKCMDMRAPFGRCGLEGKLFQAKPVRNVNVVSVLFVVATVLGAAVSAYLLLR